MIFKAIIFVVLSSVTVNSFAVDANLKDTVLVKGYPKEPLLNEVVSFEPVAGHKFNLVAKNQCGNGRLLETDEHKIECQMYAPGTGKVELYVCDDKKTFCRREELMLKTQQPKGFKAWVQYYKDSWSAPNNWATPYRTGVSQMSLARGFSAPGDFDKMLFEAKRNKKMILMYFTQAACEPCRMLKELVLSSDDFQAATSEFMKIQIDIDVETAPEHLKSLKVRGTPTLIVFNKEFKELDRRLQVASPAVFKEWLSGFDKKTKTIADLQDKSVKNLTDEERLRLSRWYASANDMAKANEYAQAFKTPTKDMTVWKKLLELSVKSEGKAINHNDIAALLPLLGEASSYTISEYKDALLGTAFESIKTPEEIKYLMLLNPFVPRFEQVLYARADKLDSSLKGISLNSSLKYLYEKTNNAALAKKAGEKTAALIDSVPRAAGVTETPFLNFMKADALKDKVAKEKSTVQLLEQNKNDYTYDYFNAQEEFQNKNYEQALVSVDKSLSVAKDRSWQKAFLLKLDILKALNREEEGLKLMESLLVDIRLPSLPTMKVHGFIQALRKKQADFHGPTKKL